MLVVYDYFLGGALSVSIIKTLRFLERNFLWQQSALGDMDIFTIIPLTYRASTVQFANIMNAKQCVKSGYI